MESLRRVFRGSSTPTADQTAASTSQDNAESNLYSTAGEHGIRTLSDPTGAIVDIVFLHGITGNRENTWTDKKSKLFWPKDLLAADIPTARIMTFGYDADIVNALSTASSNTLRDHGKSLANDLAIRRMKTNSNDRPIIFVVHSLGGLVCEQGLLICRGAAQEHYRQILESTRAIAFMGTPHAGSDHANWAGILTGLSSIVKATNKEIVAVLKPGSEMLANVQQEFHVMLDARRTEHKRPIDLFCFYEELPVFGVGTIVPKHSAILTAYQNRSIHGDHINITKFSGKDDPGYLALEGQLWIWMNAIQKEQASSSNLSEQSGGRTIQSTENYEPAFSRTVYSGVVTANKSHQGNIISGGGNVNIRM